MGVTVAIVGVSGYSGVELARILAEEARFELVAAYSDRWKGESLETKSPFMGRFAGLRVRPQADAERAAEEASIVALATPAEVSAELAPKLLARGARVIDLSGAFRLRDTEAFRAYYKFAHPEPSLLAEAHYGLPQVPGVEGDAPPIPSARLVANPGCYATSAILSLAPLLSGGLVEPQGIAIDGKSGVSGAGRKLAESYLFMELAENVSSYKVAAHQHTPEIELALSRVAKRDVRVTFAPHLLPIKRGLLTMAFARATEAGLESDVEGAVAKYYAPRLGVPTVVETGSVEEASVQSVWCTPKARVGARLDVRTGLVAAAGALDNLLKGAASQALENIHRMVGSA